MSISEEQIRIIFGLKLKQIRTEHGLSLFGLSKKTGLSKSYLNEIEKGKKYPKPDKVLAIAEALNTPYDELVSMKLSGNMAPLSDIIKSGILKEIPLNHFGIAEGDLIDIIANAPDKVSAFITTLFEISRNYNLTRENFFLAALRSYQESKDNYFKDLEDSATQFRHSHQLNNSQTVKCDELEEILVDEYGYTIDRESLKKMEVPGKIRSVFIPKTKRLLIASNVTKGQLLFIFAKELGFAHLKIEKRPLTFTWINFDNFDDVLNNFRASYFAGALLLPEQQLVDDLTIFFRNEKWNNHAFLELLYKYTHSAETFFQRLTNILPKHFGLKDIFFLRFSHHRKTEFIHLTKELHLSKSHQPHAIQNNEKYCRRWISTDILLHPEHFAERDGIHVGAQVSVYGDGKPDYFIMAANNQDYFYKDVTRSFCIGFEMTAKQKRKIEFLNDESVLHKQVGVTCERCGILDCKQRVKEPVLFDKKQRDKELKNWVHSLKQKQSENL